MSLPFDPEECKVKVGIEVHQQLAAPTKLFCPCPTVKSEELPLSFERRLRPSQSELGRIDPAAVFEFNKGKVNQYRWNPESACLVDADEEPPHPMNSHALDTTLLISRMLGAHIIDEVHVMRKIVIDGSNTSGYQRTSVVGLGGSLDFDGKSVGVQSITVEEDSSRVLGEDESYRRFALDRLGVPLVEVALDPLVGNPEDVESAALHLGRAMRSTGRVARGLGTIRQDLNVSVMGGDVVEVKGVQKLNLVAKVVRYEACRQMGLLKVAQEIEKRGVSDVRCRTLDVTSVFGSPSSGIIKKVIDGGGRVVCVSADGLGGLLGFEPYPGIRLGKELAEIARTNSLGGVIHSDEFRKQKVTDAEESELRARMSVGGDAALVLVAGPESRITVVAELLTERLRAATGGVPRETRAATDEGETRYMRPRPGAARMYPETDIPEIVITKEKMREVDEMVPVPWEEKVATYTKDYGLSRELALQLYDSGQAQLFEKLARELKLDRSVLASILVESPARVSREGVSEEKITSEILEAVARSLDSGLFAKEAAYDVLRLLASGDAATVGDALQMLDIKTITDAELEGLVADVVGRNHALIAERGDRAFSVLMGEVMKVARGKVDGGKVSATIKRQMAKVRPPA
ncbi:MAG: Glu-tRNA(Gln) amidotransferase subunit GatE [Thaumarchaeota archaeon]|nr:Glu-tRNA(Gln) amidotransferase subunit GatE [Nitrososphaerota archaeon]